MTASAAISGTVYYAINTNYTMKLWVKYGTYGVDPEEVITMTDTGRSYKGLKIYSASFSRSDRDGVGYVGFQAFEGETWKWSDMIIDNSWTTDFSSYDGKIKEANVSGMQAYAPDCLKGSWDNFEDPIYFEDGVATKDITAGDAIRFKFILAGTWYGAENDGATMFWYDSSDWTFKPDGDGHDCYIHTAVTGTYTFTLDAANKKISVTFPDYTTNEVYFYNNHSWGTPVVYLLGSTYWDTSKGSGSYGRSGKWGEDKGHEMTRVGETNVWKLEYPSTLNSSYIAIVKDREDNQGNFEDTEAVYRKDFNSSKPLYVPNTTDPINKNFTDEDTKWTAYWNTGEWYSYSAPSSAYSRTGLTIGNFGTICLPYAATVEGATVYKITNKIVESEVLKGINIEPVVSLEAGKTYIFKATSTTLTATLSGNFTGVVTGGMMEGNLASARKAPINSYVIGGKEIHKVIGDGVNVGQYKGWIIMENVPVAPTSARSADFISFADSETTAIETVKQDVKANGEYFNLAGQRVAQPTKGLYIVNGKKVIMK